VDPDGLLLEDIIDGVGDTIDKVGCWYIRRLYRAVKEPGISEAERIKRIRKLYEAFGNLGWVRHPNAAAVMRHWLSGSEKDFRISRALVLSVPEGTRAREHLLKQIKDNIMCAEAGMTPTFEAEVATPRGTDLYYTTGRFTLKAEATYYKPWVCRSCERLVYVRFRMRDPYDWHTDLGVTICGLYIPDSWAYDLGVADGLKAFDVYAQWTENLGCVKCTCASASKSKGGKKAKPGYRWW